jgi:hypothetical protein
MAEERVLTGGCACGGLTFRARGAPDRVGLCHCMTCRKASGSAFGAFAIYPADRVDIEGPVGSWAAGATRRCFCPVCASRVFSRTGDEIEIGLGAFDQPNLVRPTYEAWSIRREHWLGPDRLVSYPRDREQTA